MMRRLFFLALCLIALQVGACFAQSPGVLVGTTWEPIQTRGSVGNMITVCADRSKYFVWMNGVNPRHVCFNYIDNTGVWYAESTGAQVCRDLGASFAQIDKIYGNRAAIAFYLNSIPYQLYSTLAIDCAPPGLGIFDFYNPLDSLSGNLHAIWPKIAVDRSNRIHLLMAEGATTGDPQRMYYTRSNDGGTTWVSPIQLVDTVMIISGIIKASQVSDKVVIAYSKPVDTTSQSNNDIVYILSNDGLTWDFQNRINVTNYGNDNDSIWAFADLDVIFDYDDNIHIAWNALDSESGPHHFSRTHLFHFNSGNNQIDQIRQPWPVNNLTTTNCDLPYAFNLPLCKMNLGVYRGGMHNFIFATWTQYDTSDCSSGGYANGDIYMSVSSDLMPWLTPINLTNSSTPGCICGNCDNDNYASLADGVTDSLRVFYSDDKNNGCTPDIYHPATESRMLYLTTPNPVPAIGIDDQSNKPSVFQLAQNYPNPFNSKTIISFELKEAAKVKLDVFVITGAKVATLVNNKEMAAGHHQVNWDAEKYASGTYFYKLSAGEKSVTKQMVLVK
jgi:hypothetical protein